MYLAIKHIFPDVPINAGCFEPLHIADPHNTFLYARYPRPVSGCAAEVSSRIAESVFTTLSAAIPDDLFAAPAGTSGNLSLGGYDPLKERHYIMYVFSGGGYGGHLEDDGLTNGCSTIGISKTQPTEVLEQHYPLLFEQYALRERSGGAGKTRGGFGVDYRIRIRRGEGLLSFLMDHGRVGPPGLFGGHDGAPNEVIVEQGGRTYTSPHWSKDEDIRVTAGDLIIVRTPGGGGYGDPLERDPALVRRDVARGYFTAEDAERDYGVVLRGAPLAVDAAATARARAARDRLRPAAHHQRRLRMRRSLLALAVLVALAVVGAGAPDSAHAQKAFKIAAIVPVSGPAAAFGLGCQRGLELAAEDIGVFTVAGEKYKLEVVTYDTVYDAGQDGGRHQPRRLQRQREVRRSSSAPACTRRILPIIRETGLPRLRLRRRRQADHEPGEPDGVPHHGVVGPALPDVRGRRSPRSSAPSASRSSGPTTSSARTTRRRSRRRSRR